MEVVGAVVVVVFGATLRGVVVVLVVGVVRLAGVVRVVVGFVVFGLLGPNVPPPTVEPVESFCAKADATEIESAAINPIRRSIERAITFLLLIIKDEQLGY